MLAAHLVPGYFAAVGSQSKWPAEWSKNRRIVLWMVALVSTFAPDWDVIYNGLFRGFVNHSTLWTHSLFVHLGIGLSWLLLRRLGRWPFVQTLVGLATIGGLSHLFLDTISHGTTLLYPFSLHVFVFPWSIRVLEGGLVAYMTDPIFLMEVLLITIAVAHWITTWGAAPTLKKAALLTLASGFVIFSIIFWISLPILQNIAAAYLGNGL